MDHTVKPILKWARDLLESNDIEDSAYESRLLLAHSLNINIEETFLIDGGLTQENESSYKSMISRRALGEPSAYIIGYTEFFGEIFHVDSRVLIPRPETELLVDNIAKYLNTESKKTLPSMKIVDIGTGSGCIAISLAKLFPQIKLLATDISKESLELAKSNAENHGVVDQVAFCENDILENIEGPFDIIVSNPPYINSEGIPFIQREIREHEPQIALDGGVSGTDILFRLIKQANDKLSKDGYLAIEIGLGQEQEILDYCNRIFSRNAKIAVEKDLAGIPRVLLVKNSE
tara:strand:+ start:1685 stop:2554 length:870 start_codon:yes stop_codon:yes gene_type:complete